MTPRLPFCLGWTGLRRACTKGPWGSSPLCLGGRARWGKQAAQAGMEQGSEEVPEQLKGVGFRTGQPLLTGRKEGPVGVDTGSERFVSRKAERAFTFSCSNPSISCYL